MSWNKWRRPYAGAMAVTFVCLFTACDPPGKPTLDEGLKKVPMDFKTIYATNCSGCHGADGRQGPGRILNDPLYLAVSSPDNIRNIVNNGRPGTLMPAFAQSNGGPLNPKQVDVLLNGMETNWAKPFNANGAPLPSYNGSGFTGDVANGRKLFLKDCFACHAKGGIAGPVNDPAYLSLSTNQNLRTSIIVGRPDFPGVPMPNYRVLNAGRPLSNQDIADIVAFLSSLRPKDTPIAIAEMKKASPTETENKEKVQ